MENLSIFSIGISMLLLGMVIVLLAIAGFCYFMKRIEKKRGLSPRMAKWVYILDWTEEDKK